MRQRLKRAAWVSVGLALLLTGPSWAQAPTGELFNSMPEVASELREALLTATDLPTLVEAAQRLPQTTAMSSLIPLPTPGVDENRLGFGRAVEEIKTTIGVLREAGQRQEIPDEARALILRQKTNLEAELDTILTIAAQTARIEPDTPEAEQFLSQGLDEKMQEPEAHDPRHAHPRPPVRSRQVRSPWPPLPWAALHEPQEDIRVATIGINECMVVLKEIQGLKRRVRWLLIPIWVEPWAARARIVGFRKVWIYEWVPAEFIKKIITCNDCCNNITQEVHREIIEEPELLDFWHFYRKDP